MKHPPKNWSNSEYEYYKRKSKEEIADKLIYHIENKKRDFESLKKANMHHILSPRDKSIQDKHFSAMINLLDDIKILIEKA